MSTSDDTPDGPDPVPSLPTVRIRTDLPGTTSVTVTGDLDAMGAPALDEALVAASQAGDGQVTVDLCGVTFLGVPALRALLQMTARSNARGRAVRIVVATAHASRLLTSVGIEQVTQIRVPPPPVDGRAPEDPATPRSEARRGRGVRGHLTLLDSAPGERSPDAESETEPEPETRSPDPELALLQWATSWSTCRDVPMVVDAIAEEAVRSVDAAERARVTVFDSLPRAEWSEASDRSACTVLGASWPDVRPGTPDREGRSVLTLRLGGPGAAALGTLTVTSDASDAFGHDARRQARFFAAIATGVIAGTRHRHHLARALVHRDTIGQAKGMIIERYGMSAEAAFAVLQRLSSTSNTKLHVVAELLVRTGKL